MSPTAYFLLTIFLISAEWIYIQLARVAGWFDKPNERSSHESVTIVRAGGLVIYLAVIGVGWLDKFHWPQFELGVTVIALISFWDDFSSVPKRYRLAVHVLAVGLLLAQERLYSGQWYVIISLIFVCVGLVNAYNFMDGINGMTALYSLVTVATFWYCTTPSSAGTDSLWPGVFIALLVFSYGNVRRQAIYFAGDVGSISMGFLVAYGLLEATLRSQSWLPLLWLSIYGIDTFGTIICRLYHRQPIFRSHRMHLFQRLVHVSGWPHLRVAALYAAVQAGINILVILAMDWLPGRQLAIAGVLLSLLIMVYVWAINVNKVVP